MNLLLAALVNGAILGAALTAALWSLLRLTPRRVLNAATRYALWWATLVVVVALPLVYLPMPVRHAAAVRGLSTPSQSLEARPILPGRGVERNLIPSRDPQGAVVPVIPPPAPRPPLFPVQIVAAEWPRWILFAWAVASGLLLLRLAASFMLLGRTSRRATEVQSIGVSGTSRRGVRLAESPDIAIPVAVGPWRPAILIPTGLLEQLGEPELEQIVLHEASHLERRDDYALLLQRFIEAVFSLHPVVRWIARRIDLEREVACDDRVIALTGRVRSYATCLTRVVEWSGGVRSSLAAATAAEDGSHLARRVDMLLDKTRHTGTQLLKTRLTAIVTMVIALAWLAGRSPGFVAFASPLVLSLQRAPARILPRAALFLPAAPQGSTPQFEGRVLEDSSGNPLPSAEIRFRKAGVRELAADLDTDRNGMARVAGLADGEYALEIMKPNFVTASMKVRVPLTGFTVRLVRYGVISGQIMDQNGRPAPAFVHIPGGRSVGGTRIALLVKNPAGGQFQVLRESAPDEDGRYRIFDLTPGQYALGVWYDGLDAGSGVQLYPDNQNPRLFTVSGGEEYDHIDFLITNQATYQVSGRIEGGKKGDHYVLALGLPGQPALPIARALSDADGTFRFAKIPAGSYDLMAGGPSRGYGAHDDVLGPNSLFARVHLDVGQNVEGLPVPVGPAKSVTVTLKSRGGDTPPPGCPQSAAVGAEPLEPWSLYFTGNANTQTAFGKQTEIRNLGPGRFRIALSGLPEGCYQTEFPVVDLAGVAPRTVAIELSQAGSIRGTVRGAPHPAEYSVVLLDAAGAPDSAAQIVKADGQGHFAFESLHPGRYRLAAQSAADLSKSRLLADVSKLIEIDVAAGGPTEIELPVAAKAGRQ